MSAITHEARRPTGLSDQDLAAQAVAHGTPLYVYDLGLLRARVCELKAALGESRARLFFATMANDCPPVLRALAEAGLGACVNSIPHMELARNAGFAPETMQFTSTGVSREDMRVLQRLAIRANMDSLMQLQAWFALGGREAGIRVNAASVAGRGHGDRIGVEASDVDRAVEVAGQFAGQLTGIHVYLGTNFQDAGEMLATLEPFFALAARIPRLSYVNVGGGLGVDYTHQRRDFDVQVFGEGLALHIRRLRARLERDIELIVEPGRGLTAQCGTFLTSITDVKQLGGRRLAAVDGSIAIFPRPFHHPDTPHRIRYLTARAGSARGSDQLVQTVVVGRTTFSRDILGSAQLPEDLRIGDLLALDDAGAYSQSMASRFLGQPAPHVAFLND